MADLRRHRTTIDLTVDDGEFKLIGKALVGKIHSSDKDASIALAVKLNEMRLRILREQTTQAERIIAELSTAGQETPDA